MQKLSWTCQQNMGIGSEKRHANRKQKSQIEMSIEKKQKRIIDVAKDKPNATENVKAK